MNPDSVEEESRVGPKRIQLHVDFSVNSQGFGKPELTQACSLAMEMSRNGMQGQLYALFFIVIKGEVSRGFASKRFL